MDWRNWKKTLCKYYQDGTCNKDKRLCDYAHGEKDLQLYKSSICEFHGQGRCREGNKCTFAHGSDDLRLKCKFHFEFRDGCLQGEKCPFSHVKGRLPLLEAKQVEMVKCVHHICCAVAAALSSELKPDSESLLTN